MRDKICYNWELMDRAEELPRGSGPETAFRNKPYRRGQSPTVPSHSVTPRCPRPKRLLSKAATEPVMA